MLSGRPHSHFGGNIRNVSAGQVLNEALNDICAVSGHKQKPIAKIVLAEFKGKSANNSAHASGGSDDPNAGVDFSSSSAERSTSTVGICWSGSLNAVLEAVLEYTPLDTLGDR